MWMAVLATLKTNWVSITKWTAIILLVLVVWWKLDSAWSNYKEAVETKHQELRTLSLDKQAAIVAAETAQAAIAQAEETRKLLTRLIIEARVETQVARDESRELMAAFERNDGTKHDLQKAANRHGVWVGKLATDASNSLMEEFENEINN